MASSREGCGLWLALVRGVASGWTGVFSSREGCGLWLDKGGV